jgi:two-component system osmolarity sensor histidine kinase EnvZ
MKADDSNTKSLLRQVRPDLAFFRWIKQFLPHGLYGRALLILVTPVIITQALATYIFYERHWQTVANRLTFALAGEIAVIVSQMEHEEPQKVLGRLKDPLAQIQEFTLEYEENKSLNAFPMRGDYGTIFARMLLRALDEKLNRPVGLDLRYAHEWIAVHVPVRNGILTVIFPERRVYTPTTQIFIVWMIGSSAFLSIIAILFLRNQIRPIRRLAEAAEKIGKGQDVPHFKPEGAREVRQAAINLLIMRDRIKRQVAQRTAMLSGVSHDLRTPLTRMKLQLALMPQSEEIQELKSDVEDMTHMIEAYLDFAKGEDPEEPAKIDLDIFLEEIVFSARRIHDAREVPIHFIPHGAMMLTARPNALRRAINNLVSNAARYGKEVWISLERGEKHVFIIIDDNGPGIPATMRIDVFRPFMRLEGSRNPQTGGIGLGLTIARDIVQQHGGNIMLDDSPQGGLRATIHIPF